MISLRELSSILAFFASTYPEVVVNETFVEAYRIQVQDFSHDTIRKSLVNLCGEANRKYFPRQNELKAECERISPKVIEVTPEKPRYIGSGMEEYQRSFSRVNGRETVQETRTYLRATWDSVNEKLDAAEKEGLAIIASKHPKGWSWRIGNSNYTMIPRDQILYGKMRTLYLES